MDLLHLRYLSLRGCRRIVRLPKSLANLGQLQTLDVRGTSIYSFPDAIAKLQKLQYLHALGSLIGDDFVDALDAYLPRGISKLRALHTLRVVNVRNGNQANCVSLEWLVSTTETWRCSGDPSLNSTDFSPCQ